MKSDIDNVTESDPMLIRMHFEVDARGVTLDAVRDLEQMVRAMMRDQAVQHLYDDSYEVTAVIKAVGNPLKYQVCVALAIRYKVASVVLQMCCLLAGFAHACKRSSLRVSYCAACAGIRRGPPAREVNAYTCRLR